MCPIKSLDRYEKYDTMAVDWINRRGGIIMAEDPWGYVHYSNVTGSNDSGSGGSGCSPGCLTAIFWAIVIFFSILSGCSH